jgi:hypothetical protein
MSVEVVRSALLWCTVINYELLLVWALVYRLTSRYPCICDLPDEQVDDGVWCSGPLRQPSYTRATVLGLIYPRVDEVLPFVIETATALGLTVFDWQSGEIHRPDR